jgi:heme-degrading monooxygenase HmoA
MNPLRFTTLTLLAFALLQACAGDDKKTALSPSAQAGAAAISQAAPASATAPAGADGFEGCTRGAIEADLQSAPLAGPGVQNGELAPGQYVMSSTYLQLQPEKTARFAELIGPIMADLASREGLLAISLGNAPACSVARTLTVWRDETAMFEFVVGDAHAAAMRAVAEISRGGSVVTHWTGDQSTANWSHAAEQLAADDGPLY